MISMAKAGQITPNDYLRPATHELWFEAKRVKGLEFASTSPPISQPRPTAVETGSSSPRSKGSATQKPMGSAEARGKSRADTELPVAKKIRRASPRGLNGDSSANQKAVGLSRQSSDSNSDQQPDKTASNSSNANTPAPARWFIANGKAVDGPFGYAYVDARRATGDLSVTSLLCPEGSNEWEKVNDWPQFSSKPGEANRAPLPSVANAICSYATFVRPALWLIGLPLVFLGNDSVVDFLISLSASGLEFGAVLAMFVGASFLRKCEEKGWKITTAGLSISVLVPLFAIGISFLSELVTPADEGTPLTFLDVLNLLSMFLWLATWAFEVFALTWLLQNKSGLKLQASSRNQT